MTQIPTAPGSLSSPPLNEDGLAAAALKKDLEASIEFSVADYDSWEATAELGIGEALERTRAGTSTRRRLALWRYDNRPRFRKQVVKHWLGVYQKERGAVAYSEGEVVKFLEWLLAHADEIFSFVSRIMLLFA